MPDMNLCEIIALLDRSGSMASIKSDMEGGFDTFVGEQKKAPGACALTLVQFDTEGIDTVHEAKPIASVPALVLVPRGGTPLLDAMGKTIKGVGDRYERTPDDKRPGRVLFLVITDGHENASREYKREQIKQMVEHQTSVYGWQFSYLGANVDAFAEAGGLGVSAAATSNFVADSAGVKAAYAAVSGATLSYRSGAGYGLTDEQRRQMDHRKKA